MAKKTLSMPKTDTAAQRMTPIENMIHGGTSVPQATNNSTVIRRNISIDPVLYKTLKRYAADNDTSVSGLLSKLATEFLDKENYR